jgi:hypothetical protein
MEDIRRSDSAGLSQRKANAVGMRKSAVKLKRFLP